MSAGRAPGAVPDRVAVAGGHPLTGTVRTPGDKSVSHRALLLGALAEGTSVVDGLSDGLDVAHTRACLVALGARVSGEAPGRVEVAGGPGSLAPCAAPLDCGNSGTGLRLLAGLVAGIPGRHVLVGDASLSARPMDRIAVPLRAMGATVAGEGPRDCPPLVVEGGALHAITYEVPVASAQVKSCLLLAALAAEGETVVREATVTRPHTEELLAAMGAALDVAPWGDAGREVRLRPGPLRPLRLEVPGDPSQAAFWLVAATVVAASSCTVRGVYAGEERTGFVGVLRRMGADLRAGAVTPTAAGPLADYTARAAPLHATVVDAAEIPSVDEVPILAVAAARASGTTVFRDVGELRVKEVDRFAATIELVRAFGADAGPGDGPDDLVVHGVGEGGHLAPGTFDSRGDHRMAMAAVVAAAAVPGGAPSTITGVEAVATSYPSFLADFAALGGRTA